MKPKHLLIGIIVILLSGCTIQIETSEAPHIGKIEELYQYSSCKNFYWLEKIKLSDVPYFIADCYETSGIPPEVTSKERRLLNHLVNYRNEPNTFDYIKSALNLSNDELNALIVSLSERGLLGADSSRRLGWDKGSPVYVYYATNITVPYSAKRTISPAGILRKDLLKSLEDNEVLSIIKGIREVKSEQINGKTILMYDVIYDDLNSFSGSILCGQCKEGDYFVSIPYKDPFIIAGVLNGNSIEFEDSAENFSEICDSSDFCRVVRLPQTEPYVDDSELISPPILWEFFDGDILYSVIIGLNDYYKAKRFPFVDQKIQYCTSNISLSPSYLVWKIYQDCYEGLGPNSEEIRCPAQGYNDYYSYLQEMKTSTCYMDLPKNHILFIESSRHLTGDIFSSGISQKIITTLER